MEQQENGRSEGRSPFRAWWERLPPAQRRLLPVLVVVLVVLVILWIPTRRDREAAEDTLEVFVSQAAADAARLYEDHVAESFLTQDQFAALLDENRGALLRTTGVEVECSSSPGGLSAASSGPFREFRGRLVYAGEEVGPRFDASLIKQGDEWRITEFLIGPNAREC